MGYLGNTPGENFITFSKQVFTIVNSQTAYTLNFSVVDENELRLVINNVVQEPGTGKAYTASGTTLTLASALTNGTDEMYCVFLGKARETVTVPTITKDKLNLISNATAGLTVKGDGGSNDGYIALNCSQNSHAVKIKAPPHSAGQSYTLTLPQSITNNTFLKTDGSGNLSFASAGGLAMADQFRLSANRAANTSEDITTNIERVDTDGFGQLGTGMTESSGIFTFPSTGIYYLELTVAFYIVADNAANVSIYTTTDGTNYGDAAIVSSGNQSGGANEFTVSNRFVFDVTNTSTHKVKLVSHSIGGGSYVRGETDRNRTAITFFKLGDT